MPKKVLVTGANGFTGSHLCRKLVERGDHVLALVRASSKRDLLHGVDVEFVSGDLSQETLPAEALRGVDTVYNVAAVFRTEGVPDKYFYQVNADGVERLLHAARQADVSRFVHCSTIGVLGAIKNPPAPETAPYNPDDVYQRSKLEGEKRALAFQQKYDFPLAVVRPAAIYGPGDMRLLKLFRAIDKGVFWMIGDGEVYFHMVYVEDLANGIILAGERPEAIGEVFIIAGDEYIKLNDLVQLIGDILGRSVVRRHIPVMPVMVAAVICQRLCRPLGIEPPLYPRRLRFFTKSRAFDISKAKQVLGYQPRFDLRTGLTLTAEWYRQQDYIRSTGNLVQQDA
jgi:nucleoside-diphosphate-sugar epimerase